MKTRVAGKNEYCMDRDLHKIVPKGTTIAAINHQNKVKLHILQTDGSLGPQIVRRCTVKRDAKEFAEREKGRTVGVQVGEFFNYYYICNRVIKQVEKGTPIIWKETPGGKKKLSAIIEGQEINIYRPDGINKKVKRANTDVTSIPPRKKGPKNKQNVAPSHEASQLANTLLADCPDISTSPLLTEQEDFLFDWDRNPVNPLNLFNLNSFNTEPCSSVQPSAESPVLSTCSPTEEKPLTNNDNNAINPANFPSFLFNDDFDDSDQPLNTTAPPFEEGSFENPFDFTSFEGASHMTEQQNLLHYPSVQHTRQEEVKGTTTTQKPQTYHGSEVKSQTQSKTITVEETLKNWKSPVHTRTNFFRCPEPRFPKLVHTSPEMDQLVKETLKKWRKQSNNDYVRPEPTLARPTKRTKQKSVRPANTKASGLPSAVSPPIPVQASELPSAVSPPIPVQASGPSPLNTSNLGESYFPPLMPLPLAPMPNPFMLPPMPTLPGINFFNPAGYSHLPSLSSLTFEQQEYLERLFQYR